MNCKRIAAFLHLYYLEQTDYFLEKLKNLDGFDYDLFITIPSIYTLEECSDEAIQKIKQFKPDAKIYIVGNRGYDIAPFFYALNKINLDEYEYIIKLHTKNNKSRNITCINDYPLTAQDFFNALVNDLIGTSKQIQKNIKILEENKEIGMLGSSVCTTSEKFYYNRFLSQINEILGKLKLKPAEKIKFVAGSMFIAKATLFKVLQKSIKSENFPETDNKIKDGTLAHVYERLFGAIIENQNYQIQRAGVSKYKYMFKKIKRKLYRNRISKNGNLTRQILFLPIYRKSLLKHGEKVLLKSGLFDTYWYLEKYLKDMRRNQIPVRHYLRIGWKKGFDPSEKFSTNVYLGENPDVKDAKMNPLYHWLKHGKSEGRNGVGNIIIDFLDNFDCNKEQTKDKYKKVVILFSGDKHNGTYIWRAEYLKEELKKSGVSCDVIFINEKLRELGNILYAAEIIIFIRPHSFSNKFAIRIIGFIEKYNKTLILDVDDLLFPQFCNLIGGFKSIEQNFDSNVVSRIYETIQFNNADIISVSTKTLSEITKIYFNNKIVIVRKNSIPQSLVNMEYSYIKTTDADFFTIINTSGSNTHSFDLSLVLPELISFLSNHKNIRLITVGHVKIYDILSKMFGDRIINYDYCDVNKLYEIYREADLAIIPLDKNLFNDAKSNIKYIEAGQAATPVLARDCNEFSSVIKDGENGFLFSENNFLEKLEAIYAMPREKLAEIGRNARQYIYDNITCEANKGNELIKTIKNILGK
ncbi:MAG: glycosyltransferase [Endomicrobium sp.]|nr:glycosyltransferase [Endomicrobium sp.]